MKLTQVVATTYQSVLVYGPPKVGKTLLAGGVAEEFKVLYIGLENGHQTLTQLPLEWQERIEVILLPDTRSYPIAIETCLKIVKGGPIRIDNATGKVIPLGQTKPGVEFTDVELNKLGPEYIVIWDSMTQLTNSAISHITKNQPDDYKLNYDDWGNLGKLMDIFLSHIQQAKYHTIVISHETEAELEDGKMKIVPVAGTRNFSRNSAKYFGHAVYAEVKNMKHKFSSGTTSLNNIVAGSRTGIALEKAAEGKASLIPIFKSTTQGAQSNGQIAADRLATLKQGIVKQS